MLQCCVERLPANIVKVDVDTLWGILPQRLVRGLLLVVKGNIEAEFIFDEGDFLVGASRADDAKAFTLCELADN